MSVDFSLSQTGQGKGSFFSQSNVQCACPYTRREMYEHLSRHRRSRFRCFCYSYFSDTPAKTLQATFESDALPRFIAHEFEMRFTQHSSYSTNKRACNLSGVTQCERITAEKSLRENLICGKFPVHAGQLLGYRTVQHTSKYDTGAIQKRELESSRLLTGRSKGNLFFL